MRVMKGFARTQRSSTVVLVYFRRFYGRAVLCVVIDFTKTLRSSTVGLVYFVSFAGFYAARRVALCVFIDFTKPLCSFTFGFAYCHGFRSSAQFYGCLCVFS